MASVDLPPLKKAIKELAGLYGIEVVGYLKLDRKAVIPGDEISLLKGVPYAEGQVRTDGVRNPLDIMPEARALIILGKRLLDDRQDVYFEIAGGRSVSAESLILDAACRKTSALLEEAGFQAEEYTSYYLKAWAALAGLGWIGKSRMFVSKDHGPRLRLRAILTDAAIGEKHKVIPDESCGACTACIDACPVGAIRESEVSRKKCGGCALNHREIAAHVRSYCTCCTSACPVGQDAPFLQKGLD